jgi:histidinol-phosphatase (PHP family)
VTQPGAVDLHVHSTCSADGASNIADYARRAARLGMHTVGFCEHADFDPRDRSYRYLDPAGYGQALARATDMAPGVRLCQGVEITYQASLEDEIRSWLQAHAGPREWDYVVTSVHLVDYDDGWAMISEPRAVADYFAGHTQHQAYAPYFEELWRAVRSGLGDVIGHLDLVKRYGTAHYGPFEPAAFEQEIRAVLAAAVQRGMALEINTSGLRQAPGEAYPGLQVLRWFREMGGEAVTIGSDAHRVGDLAAGNAHALNLARAAGFGAIATFDRRQVHWLDL